MMDDLRLHKHLSYIESQFEKFNFSEFDALNELYVLLESYGDGNVTGGSASVNHIGYKIDVFTLQNLFSDLTKRIIQSQCKVNYERNMLSIVHRVNSIVSRLSYRIFYDKNASIARPETPFVKLLKVEPHALHKILSPAKLAQDMRSKLAPSPSDHSSPYYTYNYKVSYFEQVNFYVDLPVSDIFKWVNQNLGIELRYFFKSFYRITNIWLYETPCEVIGNNFNLNSKWHLDDDVFGALKVMIYLTNVSETSGPFAYEDPLRKTKLGVVGEAGTTVLFESSKIVHSATNVIDTARHVISFLIIPYSGNKDVCSFSNDMPANTSALKNPLEVAPEV